MRWILVQCAVQRQLAVDVGALQALRIQLGQQLQSVQGNVRAIHTLMSRQPARLVEGAHAVGVNLEIQQQRKEIK